MNQMESAIRLCYSSLPSAPSRQFHGANESSYARASTIRLKFNRAAMRHEVTSSFSRVNCMLNDKSYMPSENEENSGNKILRGFSTTSLALACVVGLFNLSTKLNPKFNTVYATPWPFSHANVSSDIRSASLSHGSKDALESLWQIINIDHTKKTPPKIDHEPDENTIHSLKVYAVGQSKSGKKDRAVKLVEDTYNKYKDNSTGLNLGLAWIELLIFQGKFEKARDGLHNIISYHMQISSDEPKQLLDEYNNSVTNYHKSSISQILLYKAIIHAMLKNKEASKWWEAFITTLNGN
ncbi:hypothetical protein Lalb_Chr07g0188571 [Lupinus albus]|uniref:Uncharacterized protein n=1 Tax=Lupinus albus TaxID=3870 RepID=A0A6A4QBC8_LUPAL|nr:hypothetical protein Lalb_Chr07g0188571 [Lupinus albus]